MYTSFDIQRRPWRLKVTDVLSGRFQARRDGALSEAKRVEGHLVEILALRRPQRTMASSSRWCSYTSSLLGWDF